MFKFKNGPNQVTVNYQLANVNISHRVYKKNEFSIVATRSPL